MFLTIEVTKEENCYNARCVELDVDVRSDTSEHAIEKLKKVIDFYISTAREEDEPAASAQAKKTDISNEEVH
jgi:predicted RNase H-like HicB family nuclease